MDKKEFKLDNADFNMVLMIGYCEKIVLQFIDGKLQYVPRQRIADEFWKSMAAKYNFIHDTLDVNLPGRDARYFLAVPMQ